MSYPTFPETLPPPHRSGFGQQRIDGRRKAVADLGLPSFGRRGTLEPAKMGFTLTMDRMQVAIFERFYRETTGGGTDWFWMPDPITHHWPMLDENGDTLLDENGNTLLDVAMMLTSWGDTPPELVEWRGTTFTYQFEVTILP
ncbi:hypothetical protein J4E08_10105 [Sagittula sp. NFXS13]|uniref:hypothetical protein n=1 Tax=Sagittula sp. NFXS13 TaxID=2819095 RepID=UPI0032DE3A71